MSGASRVVFCDGWVDSSRELTVEMSRVSEAKMLFLRKRGRMSLIVTALSLLDGSSSSGMIGLCLGLEARGTGGRLRCR